MCYNIYEYGRLFIKSEDNVHKWCEGICVKSWGKTGGIPHLHHLSSTKTHTCTTSDPGNWNKRNWNLALADVNSILCRNWPFLTFDNILKQVSNLWNQWKQWTWWTIKVMVVIIAKKEKVASGLVVVLGSLQGCKIHYLTPHHPAKVWRQHTARTPKSSSNVVQVEVFLALCICRR